MKSIYERIQISRKLRKELSDKNTVRYIRFMVGAVTIRNEV